MKQPERVMENPESQITQESKSVLMLEDDASFSEILRDFLESNSFSVQCAANGAEGLRQIVDKDFDIIVCDLVMPHLPGDMFYLAVQRAKPHLCKRIVFMSGYQANPKWNKFIRTMKAPVLWKPFLLRDLLVVIDRILEKN